LDVHLPAKARRRVGALRWSVGVARNNYMQFGGKPKPSPLLEMLGDQDFGEKRPVVGIKGPPGMIVKETDTQQAAASKM